MTAFDIEKLALSWTTLRDPTHQLAVHVRTRGFEHARISEKPRGDFCRRRLCVFSPLRVFFVSSVSPVHCELFPMETSSASNLRKVCPQCSTTVHVRRAVCGCGYAFPSKRRARPELQAMKHERADRLHKVNVRTSETPEQTMNRQE